MTETRYVPNPAGVAALALDAQMSAAMVQVASAAEAYAVMISPKDSGTYARSFRVVPATVYAGRMGEPRAGAILMNIDPKAAGVEWRNGAHTLARAARFIDGRKHGNDATRQAVSRVSRTESAKRSRAAARLRKRASQP